MRRRAVLGVLSFLIALTRPVLAVDSWTRVGPDEGNVVVLAAAPSQPSTVYAGLGLGGVFRSDDGGTTWSFAGGGLDLTDSVRSLVVDSRRLETLWVATFHGIYQSVNGGASWDRVFGEGAAALAQDPVSHGIYAGSQSGPLIYSRGGGSWQALDRAPQHVSQLAIDPTHHQTLYAGTLSGLFKSTNGGVRWSQLTRGLPALPITSLTLDPRSGTLYAAISNVIPGEIVFRSDDGGEKWTSIDGGVLGFTTALAVQPGSRGAVWAISAETPFLSRDRGRTWSAVKTGLPADAVFTVLPGASSVLVGTASGAFRSDDQGGSWRPSSQGMWAATISGLALDPQRPNRLWASTFANVYRTATGGDRWARLPGAPSLADGPLAADPSHPGTAYLGAQGGVAYTRDAGNHWTLGPTLSCLLPQVIAVDPSSPSRIYVTGIFFDPECGDRPDFCATFRSDDAGQGWTCIRKRVPGADFLAPDPVQDSRVYALVQGSAPLADDVYVSADRGGSWSLLASGINIFFLVPDPARPGTIWGGGGRPGLLRSDDGGKTWAPWGTGIPQFTDLTTLALDSVDPDVLYVGTLQRGVFKSSDGGATWAPLGTGLEGLDIRHLAIDPRDRGTVYAGTDEAGVLKLRQPGS